MKEFWNAVQFVFTAVGGWLGYFLGGCDGLLYALIVFVAIDYITGSCVQSMTKHYRVRLVLKASAGKS